MFRVKIQVVGQKVTNLKNGVIVVVVGAVVVATFGTTEMVSIGASLKLKLDDVIPLGKYCQLVASFGCDTFEKEIKRIDSLTWRPSWPVICAVKHFIPNTQI